MIVELHMVCVDLEYSLEDTSVQYRLFYPFELRTNNQKKQRILVLIWPSFRTEVILNLPLVLRVNVSSIGPSANRLIRAWQAQQIC